MAISDWSTTASSNSTIDGINIAEGCAAGNLNNAIRALMAGVRASFSTFWLGVLTAADQAGARNGLGAAASGANADITSLQSSCTATTQTAADNSTKIATTAYADAAAAAVLAKALGVGQTWQDMTSSRSVGSSYTNGTGRPIYVSACCNVAGNSFLTLTVDGVAVAKQYAQVSGTAYTVSAIIPAGSSYSITSGSDVVSWAELR